MSDNVMAIAATQAQHACRGEPDLMERIKKAMKACHGHWMETNPSNQFRAAVAAAMLESEGLERDRIERSAQALNRALMNIREKHMNAPVLVKRPVAFRIPRVVDDKLSTTEWRYVTDEEVAYTEAEALGIDYQALYVRDGTMIVQDRDEVAGAVVELCAKHIEALADKQEETNAKYPDHAKSYPSWVDRIQMYRLLASEIRSKMSSSRALRIKESPTDDKIQSLVRAWRECPEDKRPSKEALAATILKALP